MVYRRVAQRNAVAPAAISGHVDERRGTAIGIMWFKGSWMEGVLVTFSLHYNLTKNGNGIV